MSARQATTKRWQCSRCDALHPYEASAEDCCPTVVYEVFVCPVCVAVFDDEQSSLECCDTDLDAMTVPTHAELEAAGQMRLSL